MLEGRMKEVLLYSFYGSCNVVYVARAAQEWVTRVRTCNYVKLQQGGISRQY